MEDKKDNYHNEYQEEQAKKMIMWTGIIFFMILIVFVWSVNIKQVFISASSTQKSSEDEDLETIKNDLDEVFNNLKYGMDQLNSEENSQIEDKKEEKGAIKVEDEELKTLKEKLENNEI